MLAALPSLGARDPSGKSLPTEHPAGRTDTPQLRAAGSWDLGGSSNVTGRAALATPRFLSALTSTKNGAQSCPGDDAQSPSLLAGAEPQVCMWGDYLKTPTTWMDSVQLAHSEMHLELLLLTLIAPS